MLQVPVAISALEVTETEDVEVGVPVLVALLTSALLELTTVLKVDGTLVVDADADRLEEAESDVLEGSTLLLLLDTKTHASGTSSRETIVPVPSGSGEMVSPTDEAQVSW